MIDINETHLIYLIKIIMLRPWARVKTRVHPGLNLGITRVRAEGCVLALTHNNTRFNHAGIYNVLYCPRLKTLLEGVLIQFWILLTCCFFCLLGFDRTIIIVYARKRPQVSEN